MARLRIPPRTRIRRPPPLPEPVGVQLAYLRDLRKLVAFMRSLVTELVLPVLRVELAARRADAPRDLNRALDRASRQFYRQYGATSLAQLTRKAGVAASEFHKSALKHQLEQALGVDPVLRDFPARVRGFEAENVALIKSVADRYFGEVERAVAAAVRGGETFEKAAAAVAERGDVAEGRVRNIAEGEVNKLTGELQQDRQADVGIERYVWRTREDDRVRLSHETFEGNVHRWDTPPGDGSPQEGTHPGTAIGCRCWSEPYLEDLAPPER